MAQIKAFGCSRVNFSVWISDMVTSCRIMLLSAVFIYFHKIWYFHLKIFSFFFILLIFSKARTACRILLCLIKLKIVSLVLENFQDYYSWRFLKVLIFFILEGIWQFLMLLKNVLYYRLTLHFSSRLFNNNSYMSTCSLYVAVHVANMYYTLCMHCK